MRHRSAATVLATVDGIRISDLPRPVRCAIDTTGREMKPGDTIKHRDGFLVVVDVIRWWGGDVIGYADEASPGAVAVPVVRLPRQSPGSVMGLIWNAHEWTVEVSER